MDRVQCQEGVMQVANYPINLHAVALYLRKSRADLEAEKRGEGETLSKHRRALYTLAAKYNYPIVDTFEEIVSGERIIDRPEMQLLLHEVEQNRYQAVLCMDIDRLGRGNMMDQGMIQDLFKRTQTLIITPRKVYDLQNEMDEEWSEFEAFMARRELKMITRRMQRGRRQSALEGKSVSRKPPYGYLRDATLHLVPDPVTAPIVQMIYSLAVDGHGAQYISNHLTKLGIKSPNGHDHWDRSTIYSILNNPVYQGHIRWGHYRHQKNTKRNTGYVRTLADEQTRVMTYHAHEPLVDSQMYSRYLEKRSKQPSVPLSKTLTNPLAGLVICALCGRTMMRKKTYNRPHNRLLCATPGCKTRGTHFEWVEQRVLQTVQEMLSGMQLAPDILLTTSHSKQPEFTWFDHHIHQLRAMITQTQKQLVHLHDLLEQGVYDSSTFESRQTLLQQRLLLLEHDLVIATDEREQVVHADTLPLTHNLQDLNPWTLYQMTPSCEFKNKLLKLFITRITYTREKTWKEPDHFHLDIFSRW